VPTLKSTKVGRNRKKIQELSFVMVPVGLARDMWSPQAGYYEEWLISNAHSEISRKEDHIFKQTKVGSKVQYFSYKLTYFST
jgi:hypothetical protein